MGRAPPCGDHRRWSSRPAGAAAAPGLWLPLDSGARIVAGNKTRPPSAATGGRGEEANAGLELRPQRKLDRARSAEIIARRVIPFIRKIFHHQRGGVVRLARDELSAH